MMMVVLSGCGGVNAGGGASPAAFFIPGVAGYEGQHPSHINVSDVPGSEAVGSTGAAVLQAGALYLHTDTDPS
jgi:hypothetical protein